MTFDEWWQQYCESTEHAGGYDIAKAAWDYILLESKNSYNEGYQDGLRYGSDDCENA